MVQIFYKPGGGSLPPDVVVAGALDKLDNTTDEEMGGQDTMKRTALASDYEDKREEHSEDLTHEQSTTTNQPTAVA